MVPWARKAAAADHAHAHQHHDDHVHDASCPHTHGPTLDQISALTRWRDVAALIAGIAVRACSGGLFLLILTWQLGIGAAGIAGAFATGLGTALVTIAGAAMAVWAREGAFVRLSATRIARAVPLLEMLAGAMIVNVAISLFGVAGQAPGDGFGVWSGARPISSKKSQRNLRRFRDGIFENSGILRRDRA